MSSCRALTLLLASCCIAGCAQQTLNQPPVGSASERTTPPEPTNGAKPAPTLAIPPDQEPNWVGPDSSELPKFGDYVYVEELPEAIVRVAPRFPDDEGNGAEGTVMVQALVLRDGTVGATRIVKSIPMLDEAAVAAVRQWRFKPAMAKGQPVAVWVGIPIRFPFH